MTSACRLLKALSPPSLSLCSLLPAVALPSPGHGSGITTAPAAGWVAPVTSGDRKTLRVSWGVIAVAAGTLVGFSLCAVSKAARAHRSRASTGREGLVGERGRAVTALAPEGKVFAHGEYWDARCDGEVRAGEPVTVSGIEGMVLKVTRVKGEG